MYDESACGGQDSKPIRLPLGLVCCLQLGEAQSDQPRRWPWGPCRPQLGLGPSGAGAGGRAPGSLPCLDMLTPGSWHSAFSFLTAGIFFLLPPSRESLVPWGPPGREGSPGKDVSVGVLRRGCRESGKCTSLRGQEKPPGRLVPAEAHSEPVGMSHLPAPWVLLGGLRRPWHLGVQPHSWMPVPHSS